ncbi:hypothetical protein [Halomicrobium salinisoli]|uniref:hypothetical protein n=1 Tax=Halomicrobium salinisoli TaxID=2878391 RepID=UPI001CEFDF0B|nr:hypothetical protein [Halomicrobium salinisoli]
MEDARTATGIRGLARERRGTLLLVTIGYFVAVVAGLFGSLVAMLTVGDALAALVTASGSAAGPTDLPFLVVAMVSPVCFAAGVVLADLLAVRSLAERTPTVNRSGLATWTVAATCLLALLLVPLAGTLSPFAGSALARTPVKIAVAGATFATAAAVTGVAGATVPLAVTLDGRALGRAVRRAVAEARTAPRSTLRLARPLVGGWLAGAALLLVGASALTLALGLLIYGVGVLILPVALALLTAAAVTFAAGHVRYRLRTIRAYDRGDSAPSP